MSRWSIEILSAACGALLLIVLGALAGTAWQNPESEQRAWLFLLLAAGACVPAIWPVCRLQARLAATGHQLQASIRRYQRLIETAQDGMCQTDAQGRIVQMNQRMCDMIGLEKEALVGHNLREFYDDATLRRFAPLYRETDHEAILEYHYTRADGSEAWAQVGGRRLYDDDGVLSGSLVISTDITKRMLAERALALAHAELENRIVLRTAQLQDVNIRLSDEIGMRQQTEQALEQSEARLHEIISMLPLALFLKSSDSHIVLMNKACEHQWGISFEQLCARGEERHFPQEQLRHFRASDREAFAQHGVVVREEVVWNAQLHENRLVQTHKKAIFSDTGKPQLLIAVSIDITERQRNEEALRQSLLQLRELSDHQETIKETERRRIALDIHDDLGQNLMALKIDANLLQARTGSTHPRLHQHAERVLATIDATIASVRDIINDLYPSTLELGLVPAVEWLIRQMERRGPIVYRLTVDSKAPDLGLDQRQTSAIFRVLQESLTNIVRHAQASEVEVRLSQEDGHLQLRISDNGIGMQPGDDGKRAAYGLKSIRERVSALGGEIQIDSQPGQGTTLAISMPLASTVQASEENAQQ